MDPRHQREDAAAERDDAAEERDAVARERDVTADERAEQNPESDASREDRGEARIDRVMSKLDRADAAVDRDEIQVDDQMLLIRHATRERRLLGWAFLAVALVLIALIGQSYVTAQKLTSVSEQRCDERNRGFAVIIKYLGPGVNKQAVIEEAELPLDCAEYGR